VPPSKEKKKKEPHCPFLKGTASEKKRGPFPVCTRKEKKRKHLLAVSGKKRIRPNYVSERKQVEKAQA